MDGMLPPGRIYHFAYVVPDLEIAMKELGAIYEVEWAERARRQLKIRRAGEEPQDLDFWICYSTTGPPHIELIEGIPGSIWDPSNGAHLHHVGVWAKGGLEDESQRLVELGLPIEAHGVDDNGGLTRFTYHSNPYGPWIELVYAETREPFEAWMHGASFDA
jgi:hypothetical protein